MGGASPYNTLPHCLGAMGNANPAFALPHCSRRWAVEPLLHVGPQAGGTYTVNHFVTTVLEKWAPGNAHPISRHRLHLPLTMHSNKKKRSSLLLKFDSGCACAIWAGPLCLRGDGMQTAALADCERLRTNRRHAHLRQPKKRVQLIYCN